MKSISHYFFRHSAPEIQRFDAENDYTLRLTLKSFLSIRRAMDYFEVIFKLSVISFHMSYDSGSTML